MKPYPIVCQAESQPPRYGLHFAAAVAAALLIAIQSHPAHSQSVTLVAVNVEAVANGYSMRKLTGISVLNDKNEKIGTIDDFVIARDQSLFTVLQVGGFLHLGGYLVAVPYSSLEVDNNGSKIVLRGANEDAVKKLPEYKPGS
jgi:hypothetical protein